TRGRTATASTACRRPVNSSHSVTSRETTWATVTCGGGGGACCASVCVQPTESATSASDATAVSFIQWAVWRCDVSQTIGQWLQTRLAPEPETNIRPSAEDDLRLLDEGTLVRADHLVYGSTCSIIEGTLCRKEHPCLKRRRRWKRSVTTAVWQHCHSTAAIPILCVPHCSAKTSNDAATNASRRFRPTW